MGNRITVVVAAGLLATGLLASAPAAASPIEGTVVETESRWTRDGASIITVSVVESSSGGRITVQQPGGSVDGIGMVRSHSLPLLGLGDRVVGDALLQARADGSRIHLLDSLSVHNRASGDAQGKDGPREFVRTQNDAGAQIYWKSGCAFISFDEGGSSDIAGETEFSVMAEVLEHWELSAESCSDFALVYDGVSNREVGFDGHNIIMFREAEWCRPATEDEPKDCYDDAAAGLTTLYFVDDESSPRNGEILDADIELNSVNFSFAVGGESSGDAPCQADLANTLTHEIGHFVGLDHTCHVRGDRLQDHLGQPVPSCSAPNLSDDITDATMYNFQSCGETKKASLESDDISGFCAIYPRGEHTSECKRASLTTKGCCSVGASSTSPAGGWLWGALGTFGALLVLRRRKKNS